MALRNDDRRQRSEADQPGLDLLPDALEDMQGSPQQTERASTGANARTGKRDAPVSAPAVDPVCPHCRQPVYPGYGTPRDDAEFVHFDCLRHERTARGREEEAR